jgi:phenylpropionate dioxygenase-like ring-hydroxylating dioxygenase large terminal subunit
VPGSVGVRAYTTVERDGAIFAWYHPGGEAPSFEVPSIDEAQSADWSTPERYEWTLRSQI